MTESYVTLLCDYFHDFILSVNCHNHEKRFGPPFRNVSFVLALFNGMAKKKIIGNDVVSFITYTTS